MQPGALLRKPVLTLRGVAPPCRSAGGAVGRLALAPPWASK